jgi:hypothetical protein
VAGNGGAARTVRPAVELIGANGAPVVGGGGEVVKELQSDVGKLGVEAIGSRRARERCPIASRRRRWRRSSVTGLRPELEDDWGSVNTSRGRGSSQGG